VGISGEKTIDGKVRTTEDGCQEDGPETCFDEQFQAVVDLREEDRRGPGDDEASSGKTGGGQACIRAA